MPSSLPALQYVMDPGLNQRVRDLHRQLPQVSGGARQVVFLLARSSPPAGEAQAFGDRRVICRPQAAPARREQPSHRATRRPRGPTFETCTAGAAAGRPQIFAIGDVTRDEVSIL